MSDIYDVFEGEPYDAAIPRTIIPGGIAIYTGHCLEVLRHLPEQSAQVCVTSPPYFGLRDYQCEGQIGLESTHLEYVEKLVEVFRGVWRVLRDDGVMWLNLGDSYAGSWGAQSRDNEGARAVSSVSANQVKAAVKGTTCTGSLSRTPGVKAKELIGIPWHLAFALQADGWYLRSDCIWSKPNPLPESIEDRPSKSHEYMFMLSKQERYYYNKDAIMEPTSPGTRARLAQNVAGQAGSDRAHAGSKANGNMKAVGAGDKRNKRTVWEVPTRGYAGAHFATFPPKLIEPCILAGSRPGDVVLDPFGGSGTTAQVARQLGRQTVLIELNPEYVELSKERLNADQNCLFEPEVVDVAERGVIVADLELEAVA